MKFPDRATEILYNITLEGGHDEEVGTVYGLGWYGRVGCDILAEDNEGFVTRETFPTVAEAEARFAEYCEADRAYYATDAEWADEESLRHEVESLRYAEEIAPLRYAEERAERGSWFGYDD